MEEGRRSVTQWHGQSRRWKGKGWGRGRDRGEGKWSEEEVDRVARGAGVVGGRARRG